VVRTNAPGARCKELLAQAFQMSFFQGSQFGCAM